MPGFVSNGDREAVNHYYSQIVHDNRITNTRLSPEDSTTAFTLVGDSFFHYALNKDELFEKMGSPESTLTGKSNVYKWRVQREPLKHITAIPWSFEASLTPREFLRDVSSYERISFNSHFGDGVSPSLMNETGRLEFAFENATTKQNMLISLKLRYKIWEQGTSFAYWPASMRKSHRLFFSPKDATPCARPSSTCPDKRHSSICVSLWRCTPRPSPQFTRGRMFPLFASRDCAWFFTVTRGIW